jgi:hypothetical protein
MNPSALLGSPSKPVLHGVTAAVYGLVFPETRALARRLWMEQPAILFERSYDDVQDAAHGAFVAAWAAWVAPLVRGLDSFSHRYVTNGSSEAIRESVWSLASSAKTARLTPHLHVFAGEYEGYAAYARAAGVTVIIHDGRRWDDQTLYAPGALHRWYVSQPSAIDGNMWPEFPLFVASMAKRGIEVAVDLAYVGAASEQTAIDLSSPNIPYVFFSLSKIFGVFYHRVGGMLSRSPLLGLEGNKWFKNMFSLYLGTSLILETPTPSTLPAKYRHVQIEACRDLREEHGIPFAPSEVILLASSTLGPYPSAFRRGNGYRWCLTPTMDRLLRAETESPEGARA